ncbi:MAG: Ig-like domain-containing protein [Clostridia bacterium]|nr:Ig-like domain-containing protein [Clostridia bacterium]
MKRLIKRAILLLMTLALLLPTLPVAAASMRVVLSDTVLRVDLAQTNTVQLTASVLPASAPQNVVWKSGNTKIATVSAGRVRLKKIGTVYVGARPKSVKNWSKCKIVVTDSSRPTGMSLSSGARTMGVGETYRLTAELTPAAAIQSVRFASSKSGIASVSADGTITAKKAGTCKIRVTSTKNTSLRKAIKITVIVANAPTKLTITPTTKKLALGDTLQLSAAPTPASADGSVGWKTSNSNIATVTPDGLVTPHKAGTVKITAYSAVKKSVYTVRTLTVYDPDAITSVTINEGALYVGKGGTAQLTATVKPSTARQTVTWSSADRSIATVTESGIVSGVSVGTTTIYATGSDGKTRDSVSVRVYSVSRVTTVPALTTSVSGISGNLQKIDDIRLSANAELESLVAAGKISTEEMKARKNILINAFADYRFPWMTKSSFSYWQGSTSFTTGKVYYGVPYTQGAGSGSNVYLRRRYTAAKLISGGFYKKNGSYYLANNSSGKMVSRGYCGNDCSAFVSMSVWGQSTSYSYLNTYSMYESSCYKTIKKANLRPGDILVKKGHVVMFLYYTTAAKDRMMVIEQGGGSEPNTVACRVTTKTLSSAYIARRKAGFAG